MQPFPVICETCQARLKVRSDSVIGHILACPKCGSMVEIVPPADWLPADTATPSPEPVAEPQHSMAPWLGLPMLFWAVGGAVVLSAATFVGVLLTRGGAGPHQQIDAPTTAAATKVAAIDEAPRNPEAVAEEVEVASESIPPSTERAAAVRPEQRPSTVDDASIAATVEAIMSPPTESPQVAEPEPTAAKLATDDLNLVKKAESATEVSPADHHAEASNVSAPNPRSSILEPPTSLLDRQAAVRVGPASSASAPSHDAAQQLALPIQSIELPRIPLAHFVELLSDMTAVPITLDPAALRMAGVGANEETSAEADDTTVANVLTEVLAKYGLTYEVHDGLATVVKPNVDRTRSVDYEVKDLVDPGDRDAASVADLVRRFVAPESWKAAGGQGRIEVDGTSLRVDQTERVHYQILTFCERLRLARDLPHRSRYPTDRLTIDPVYPELESRLAKSTTFTFLPWTRLADVFRYWQEATGVTVLADWNALDEQELGPATPVACSIVDRPWNEALDAILGPLGLTWWAVDAHTIQITSREAASRKPQIEFYPVAKSVLDQHVSAAAFMAAWERELAGKFAATVDASPPYRIAFDEPGERLIVVGPPGVQRFVSSRLNSFEPQSHEVHEE